MSLTQTLLSTPGAYKTHVVSPYLQATAMMGNMRPPKPETSNGVELLANDEIRQLMGIIQSLRHLGIEAKDLSFPKLVVTGDQSTGKSSLIEGISDIRVPRGTGTCTRVPVEINLSDSTTHNAVWSCNIYLAQRYSFVPSTMGKATRARPLGPWVEKELETFHFATLYDKAHVGEALEWAQIATLNPSSNPESYQLDKNHGTGRFLQVPFSPNVIRMDITGPGLLNLSFYDLPGVVSQDQHAYVPDLVENLVKEYIRAENCIILHTLTMNHDAANSVAARIIKSCNAGDRTVGVLTKPDLFIQESIDEWSNILSGKKFQRRLGYYVVKNNARVEVDSSTARQEEAEFFESTPPFSTALVEHRTRFGTEQLQHSLSSMLARQIKASLPNIITKLSAKLSATQEKLAELPKPAEGNVAGLVESKVGDFSRQIAQEVGGGSIACETFLFTHWHAAAKKFSELLVCSRPLISRPADLAPPEPPQAEEDSPTPSRGQVTVEPLIITDDEQDSRRKRKKDTNTPQFGQKRARTSETTWSVPKRPSLNDRLREKSEFLKAQEYAKRFKVNEIRDTLKKLDTGVGSAGHPKVVEKMYKESIHHWPSLLEDLLLETKTLCETHIFQWIQSTFGLWNRTALHEKICTATHRFLDRAFSAEKNSLESWFKMEEDRLIVLDVEEDSFHEAEILALLRQSSRTWRREYEIACRSNRGVSLPFGDREHIDEMLRNQPDPFDDELRALAKVRSHYHTTATHFARAAALSICTRLFKSLCNDLPNEIRHELGLDLEEANQVCKRLLAIDPAVQAERERLLRDEAALLEGQNKLAGLVHPSSVSTSFNTLGPSLSERQASVILRHETPAS